MNVKAKPEKSERPEIPKDKIIQVNNSKKIDFTRPYKFIYFDWWFDLLVTIPFIITYILVLFCALFFGFRTVNRKNMKILRKQGCITISNHCHYFDTVFMYFVTLPRHLYCSVAQRNFEVPYVRRILRILRAFPIPSGPGGLDIVSPTIGEALRRKYHVHFLPEGDLVFLSQTIHQFRSGAFRLSYLHQAPVLPFVYVIKRRKFFGREMGPAWVKITQVVGEPIYPPELLDGNVIPKEEIAEMSDKAASWMEQTIALHHQEREA